MVVHQKREAKVSFPSIRREDRSLCVHGLWIGFSEGLLVELASGKKAERYAGDTTSKSKNGKIEREDGLMLLQAITRSLPTSSKKTSRQFLQSPQNSLQFFFFKYQFVSILCFKTYCFPFFLLFSPFIEFNFNFISLHDHFALQYSISFRFMEK